VNWKEYLCFGVVATVAVSSAVTLVLEVYRRVRRRLVKEPEGSQRSRMIDLSQ
jgi:hypothetical protein